MRSGGSVGLALAMAVVTTVATTSALAGGADTVRVLTYNVHGLTPPLARDGPGRRLARIGAELRAYDVALLQETFEYVDVLENATTRGVRGPGRRFRWLYVPLFTVGLPITLPCWLLPRCSAPHGAGLYTATARADLALTPLVSRDFGACAGWLDRASDCFANKGLVGVRVRLPGGAEIDVYNTHLDAGLDREDWAARQWQVFRLGDAIAEHSADRAVIVGGDFNARRTRSADASLLEWLRSHLRLVDTEARAAAPQWRKDVDYLLYRSGAATRLTLRGAGEATAFVDDAGRPLSDHPALWARFDVTGP